MPGCSILFHRPIPQLPLEHRLDCFHSFLQNSNLHRRQELNASMQVNRENAFRFGQQARLDADLPGANAAPRDEEALFYDQPLLPDLAGSGQLQKEKHNPDRAVPEFDR
jgi:hypothetical protein